MGKKKAVQPETKGTPKAGPGKKVCPGCSEVIAARKMLCECGYTFTPKAKASAAPKPAAFSDLRYALEAEAKKIQEQLENRQTLEKRLAAINAVLATFENE
jgi:hypothetical protein